MTRARGSAVYSGGIVAWIGFDFSVSDRLWYLGTSFGQQGIADEGAVAAFGEELRHEREMRGLALEAICEATKVSPKHIRALESGAFSELPGGVFRRGFVRSYLGALGLEQDPWMRRFEESCRASGVPDPADVEWAAFAENVKNGRASTRRRTGWGWLGAMLLAGVLGTAGWCGWSLATRRGPAPSIKVWSRLKSWVDNAASR